MCKKNLKKNKMLKSQEYSDCPEPLPQEWIMGGTEPPNNMLHKAKHTSCSMLSYRVGLDPIATSYRPWLDPVLLHNTSQEGTSSHTLV